MATVSWVASAIDSIDAVRAVFSIQARAIVAQGNGYQAGVSPSSDFQAAFSGSLTVASAGDVVFQLYVDDGFILGVGNGATSQPGSVMFNAPASGLRIFAKSITDFI